MALLAQAVVIYVDFGDADVLRRFVFPASYVLLVTVVVLNRRRVGILVIGVGMLLNFVVALTVSYMTAPPPERIQHLVEHIRVPRAIDG